MTKSLRYEGGGTLTFADGAGVRRRVLHGASFDVDAQTAAILLRDPDVHPATEGEDLPRGNSAPAIDIDQGRPPDVDETPPQIDLTTAKKKAMLEYAALLGLEITTRTKIDDVRASIEAELARRAELRAPLVDEAAVALVSDSDEGDQGGDGTPADDPDASASGEAGPPPSTGEDTGGAVTLGDLPSGAVVKG